MKEKLTIRCVSICPGVVSGRARVLLSPDDAASVKGNEIIILPKSHPMYAIAVMNAAAVICVVGGRTSHIGAIAMEAGVPCVTQAENAAELIRDGQHITVDADNGVVHVYE